jgi:hypothetical protein
MSDPRPRLAIRRVAVVAAAAILIMTQADLARATWRPDGEPLAPPRSAQMGARLAPDGAGGAIM